MSSDLLVSLTRSTEEERTGKEVGSDVPLPKSSLFPHPFAHPLVVVLLQCVT